MLVVPPGTTGLSRDESKCLDPVAYRDRFRHAGQPLRAQVPEQAVHGCGCQSGRTAHYIGAEFDGSVALVGVAGATQPLELLAHRRNCRRVRAVGEVPCGHAG